MSIDHRWFSVAGQALDFFAALFLLSAAIVSKRKALDLGVPRWAGSTDEENARLPQVQDRLLQSRRATWGLVLLAAGSALQIFGSWPR
jgi:hypothetical protein